jgi:hypothetical protein
MTALAAVAVRIVEDMSFDGAEHYLRDVLAIRDGAESDEHWRAQIYEWAQHVRLWGSDDEQGREFGVRTDLRFRQQDVDALIACAGPLAASRQPITRYFMNSVWPFVDAEDAAISLKRAVIDPDQWPDLYYRSADGLGSPRPASRVDAERWRRQLFSGRLEAEHAIMPRRSNDVGGKLAESRLIAKSVGYQFVELFMLKPAVDALTELARQHGEVPTRAQRARWKTDVRHLLDEEPRLRDQDHKDVIDALERGYEWKALPGEMLQPPSETVIKVKTLINHLAELRAEWRASQSEN